MMRYLVVLVFVLFPLGVKAQHTHLQLRGNVVDATLRCIIPGVKLTLHTKDSMAVGNTFSYKTAARKPRAGVFFFCNNAAR